jgi:alkanal monooxygenase alpha chain
MKFGVFLTTAYYPKWTQEEVFDNTGVYAVEAERLGYDGAWLLEHHFTRFGLTPHPVTLASYILGKTTTLRVGTAVCVLPFYHPLQMAEQVAMVDQLSNGRFDFGVGRGSYQKDFEAFGVDPSKSHVIMREWLDIIKRAWTEDAVEAHSELIDFPPVPLYPTPRVKPHPPIYVVCESPSSTEWVASQGYPMILSWWLEREAIRAQVELYDEVARSHGHDPSKAEHVLSAIACVADSQTEAKDQIRDSLGWWRKVAKEAFLQFEQLRKLDNYEFVLRRWEDQVLAGEGDPDAGERATLERLLDLNLIGTPDECVEKIQDIFETTGVRHFVVGFEGAGDRARTLESMRRFAQEVIPRAQEGVGARIGVQ